MPKNQWAELLEQLFQLCQHPSESHREIAMMLFTALAENLTKSLKKHFRTLQAIFTRGLSDPSIKVRVEALRALSTLVDMLDEDEHEDEPALVASFATVIEPLLAVMAAHFSEDDVLIAGFEVLDNLAQSPTNVLDPFIPKIAELMSRIVVNQDNESGTREKAAYLLEDLIKHKVHKLLKPTNLIPALLEVSYKLVVEPFDEDDTDATPQRWGIEILDAVLLNIHIAKKDVFPGVLGKAGELVQDQVNQDRRKGGFVILAIMAEGCGQLLVDRLPQLIPVACAAMVASPATSSVKVRMAACIVIEQFADHLHPDISAYHEKILPTLMAVLANPAEHDMVKEKCCSALDVFCQHLDSDIGRYLSTVVPSLLQFIASPLQHVSRSAMSAVAAVASAAKELFEPYVGPAMAAVGGFLSRTDEESLRQRCNATQCIGSIGSAVGKARFCAPLSAEAGQNYYDLSFHMVVTGFTLDFFELRESSFMFFAEMCEMMGEDFAPRLSVVMPLLLASLFTDDGVMFTESNAGGFNAGGPTLGDLSSSEEDMSDPDGEDDDDDDSEADDERKAKFVIRSGALDEKIAALHAIVTIMPLVRTADFARFVSAPNGRDVFTAIYELSEYPHPYVRTTNCQAIRELLLWYHRYAPPTRKWVAGEIVPLVPEVERMVMELTLLLMERMDDEDDLQCAAEACDGMGEVLQHYGLVILQQNIKVGEKRDQSVPCPQHLLSLLLRFLNEKAPSQIPEDMGDEEGEGGEGGEGGPEEIQEMEDHDFVLMESVSDLIAILPQIMGPGFEPGFREMFPVMERFMRPEKQAPTKGMCIGSFAEVLHWMTVPGVAPEAHVLAPYFPKLLGYCAASLADPSPLVKRNGAFCAGCLALVPHPLVLAAYPQMLQGLAGCYTPPSGPVDPNTSGSLRDEEFLAARDNACSAIGKMIATAPQLCGQPMSALIDLLLQPLPLQVDFNEAKSVYAAVMNLYRTHGADITPHTARVIAIFSQVFGNPDIDTAVQRDIIAFCKALTQQAPSVHTPPTHSNTQQRTTVVERDHFRCRLILSSVSSCLCCCSSALSQEMERVFAGLTPTQQTQFKKFIIDPLPA